MTDLLSETLDLARRTQLPVAKICREIGVTPRWFHKVLSGETPDPSVRRIQRLHDYLRANEPAAGESKEAA